MTIHIIFDGPPSPPSGRFVEVENDRGESINIGKWAERPDGLWALTIDALPQHRHVASIAKLEADLENARGGENTGDIEMAAAALEAAKQRAWRRDLETFRADFEAVHSEMGCSVQRDASLSPRWCVVDVDGDVIASGATPSEAMAAAADLWRSRNTDDDIIREARREGWTPAPNENTVEAARRFIRGVDAEHNNYGSA